MLQRRGEAAADDVAQHVEDDDVGVLEQVMLLEQLHRLADDVAAAAGAGRRAAGLDAHHAVVALEDEVLDAQFLGVEVHRLQHVDHGGHQLLGQREGASRAWGRSRSAARACPAWRTRPTGSTRSCSCRCRPCRRRRRPWRCRSSRWGRAAPARCPRRPRGGSRLAAHLGVRECRRSRSCCGPLRTRLRGGLPALRRHRRSASSVAASGVQ